MSKYRDATPFAHSSDKPPFSDSPLKKPSLRSQRKVIEYARITGLSRCGCMHRSELPPTINEPPAESTGRIRMHLPTAMFQNVLDVLRNEKPVYIYFAQGRGFLSTSTEPMGEGE